MNKNSVLKRKHWVDCLRRDELRDGGWDSTEYSHTFILTEEKGLISHWEWTNNEMLIASLTTES